MSCVNAERKCALTAVHRLALNTTGNGYICYVQSKQPKMLLIIINFDIFFL